MCNSSYIGIKIDSRKLPKSHFCTTKTSLRDVCHHAFIADLPICRFSQSADMNLYMVTQSSACVPEALAESCEGAAASSYLAELRKQLKLENEGHWSYT